MDIYAGFREPAAYKGRLKRLKNINKCFGRREKPSIFAVPFKRSGGILTDLILETNKKHSKGFGKYERMSNFAPLFAERKRERAKGGFKVSTIRDTG